MARLITSFCCAPMVARFFPRVHSVARIRRMGPGCEAAALTAELLAVAFLSEERRLEVSEVLALTEAHWNPNSWVPNWFLSLGDPTSLCLSGWHVFFTAIQKALEDAELATCSLEALEPGRVREALTLLRAAADAAESLDSAMNWQQAVRQRLIKDRLRHGFELLGQAQHDGTIPLVCLRGIAAEAAKVCTDIAKIVRTQDWMTQRLHWPALPSVSASTRQALAHAPRAPRIAVCVVGQPRAMFGSWFGAMTSQLLQSLCPLSKGATRISLYFVLATQPWIGLYSDIAPMMLDALQDLLQSVQCPDHGKAEGGSFSNADLKLDLRDDAPDAELQGLVEAYPEDAWWHAEGDGRLGRMKWVRQLQNLARCHQLLDEELDWVVLLRPDLLHLVPLPELQHMDPGHVMIGADSGMQITPQAGYIEGLDRALAMSARIARALLLEPLLALQNKSFVQMHPNCLKCYGWRSPGVKLTPEKHFANVFESWASQKPFELQIAYEWRQPLVVSEKGCINLLPCEEKECPMDLPRWARQLVLSHTCWQVKDAAAATIWAQGGSTEAPSGPAANILEEMFPDFRG